MNEHPEIKMLITAWLDDNRDRLPLNSDAWQPVFSAPDTNRVYQPAQLGKYKAAYTTTNFFYKPISRLK